VASFCENQKNYLKSLFFVLLSMSIYAQENLAGRVYYCGNLMEKELNDVKKESANAAKEAKSQEEKDEAKSVDAITDAIVSKMTVKFIDDKTMELDLSVKFDEGKAKKNGASWMMRKLVKMKMGKGQSQHGQTSYTVNGRRITAKSLSKKNKTQSFELSQEGMTMTWIRENTKTVLKRIK